MKLGIQHVRVTLADSESGETIVIEQSSDWRTTRTTGTTPKHEGAANTAPQRVEPSRTTAPSGQPAKSKTGQGRDNEDKPKSRVEAKSRAEVSAKAKEATRKPPAGRRNGRAKEPRKSLDWYPVKDHRYDGFAARSDAGLFKVLHTKGSQWALFYELKNTWPHDLGCFGKFEEGQKRAQELHDAGWPESELGSITAGKIARACPAPTGVNDGATEEGEMKTAPRPEPNQPSKKSKVTEETPVTEEKPEVSKSEPDSPSKTQAEKDEELLAGFEAKVDEVLDEEEDDDEDD